MPGSIDDIKPTVERRDRSRDRERGNRRTDRRRSRSISRDRSPRRNQNDRSKTERRVFVSNIPYEFRWQDLKDLFRTEVGEVQYVELFMDDHDKPKGCGVVEFDKSELAQKAIEKMHRFDIKGRKLVVKEDSGNAEREKMKNRHSLGGSSGGGGRQWNDGASLSGGNKWGNTYGLSPQFLESLNIHGSLINKVFVANLDYKVDEKKLREVFRLAGRVLSVDLLTDKDGKSRGLGVIEYEHPVEAVQAISMLHNQMLYDRRINVRMERASEHPEGPMKLPEGLKSIGMGLGANGAPLIDVVRNLPSLNLSSVQPPSLPTTPSALAALGSAALASLGQNPIGGLRDQLDGRLLDNALARRQLDLAGLGGGLLGSASSDLAGLGSGLGSSSGGYGSALGGLGGSPASAAASYLASNGGYGGGANNLGVRDYESLTGLNKKTSKYDYDFQGAAPALDRQIGGGGGYGKHSDTVIITNLPSNMTWQTLRDKFRDVGEIKFADMKGKDVGVVRFASEREAERAVTLFDRTRLEGRNIDVRLF